MGWTGFLGEQRLVERKGYRASCGLDRVPGGAEDGLEEGGTEPQVGWMGFLGE